MTSEKMMGRAALRPAPETPLMEETMMEAGSMSLSRRRGTRGRMMEVG